MLILCCRCGAAEPLARKVMREAHFEGWQTQPLVKGRAECMAALNRLPQDKAVQEVRKFIQAKSSWTIFLREIDGEYRWVDVGHGGTVNRIEAELILEGRYATHS